MSTQKSRVQNDLQGRDLHLWLFVVVSCAVSLEQEDEHGDVSGNGDEKDGTGKSSQKKRSSLDRFATLKTTVVLAQIQHDCHGAEIILALKTNKIILRNGQYLFNFVSFNVFYCVCTYVASSIFFNDFQFLNVHSFQSMTSRQDFLVAI